MFFYSVLTMKASAVFRAVFMNLFLSLALVGCVTTAPPPYNPGGSGTDQPPVTGQPDPEAGDPETKDPETKRPDIGDVESVKPKPGLTPSFMAGKNIKRVAILLPLTAKSARLREEAESMLQAAELALFASEDKDLLLIALDSAGTEAGAKQATKTAIDQGAVVILGPVLAGAVKASGREARKIGVPVIGFSTDVGVAGNGVYLLSFPPEAEVSRITRFAHEAGARKFAFLGPDSTYGKRVLDAYSQEIGNLGSVLSASETYTGNDITVMQDPAERIAGLYSASRESSEPAYHAILLPEGGTALRSLAPLLTYFDDSLHNVQLLGTGLWNRDGVVREPALNGGVFASPDLEGINAFTASFDARFGEEPGQLASLAYDAVNIAAFIIDGKKHERRERLTNPDGFFGVDGLVRFTASGTPERGLAVYQIRNERFVLIDPAPRPTGSAF